MEKNKKKTKYLSFLNDGSKIYELIGDREVKMFLSFDVLSQEIATVDQIDCGECLYLPPKDDLVSKGTILLPSYPGEFGEISTLIECINQYSYKYLDIPDNFRRLTSYYVLLSWVYDCFEVIPYLRVIGDYGTGKTRFQKVIGSICYKPMFAGGATTPSPVFRIIDLYSGTLVLDEADFKSSDAHDEIIKIFNCGYTKGIPVLRTEGEKDRIPTSYDVYGPKIIGTRKKFSDPALESRCLTIIMAGHPRKDIPIHLPKEFEADALKIRNMLLMFRLRNYGQLEVDPALVIPGIESRMNQIILPVLSIVKDDKTRKEIVEFVVGYANQLKTERSDELPALILKTMLDIQNEGGSLRYKEIAIKLNNGRDEKQGEFRITPHKIGQINASVFNFERRQIHGITEIIWDPIKAEKLCDRYGIEISQDEEKVDSVDLVDPLGGNNTLSESEVDSLWNEEKKIIPTSKESLPSQQSLPPTGK